MSDLLHRIQGVRARLTETRITAREAREDFATTRAMAETRIIDRAGGEKALGANAEARERALLPALRGDDDYIGCLAAVRELEASAERLEAELEGLRDDRREREWLVRLRLVQALEGRGAQGDGANGKWSGNDHTDPDDTSFDDVGDAEATDQVEWSSPDHSEAAQAARELQPMEPEETGFWPASEPDALDRAIAEAEAEDAALAASGEGEAADPDSLVDDEPFV